MECYLELQNSVALYGRVLEDVEVKGSAHVLSIFPLESAESHLEGVHPSAVVLQLLISIFGRVIVMLAVLESHVQP